MSHTLFFVIVCWIHCHIHCWIQYDIVENVVGNKFGYSTSEAIKPLSEIKIWLTIIIFYYFSNQCWSVLKCCSIFIISFGYLNCLVFTMTMLNISYFITEISVSIFQDEVKPSSIKILLLWYLAIRQAGPGMSTFENFENI